MIDNTEYTCALNEFLLNIGRVADEESDDITFAITPMCNVLGIGRLEVRFFDTSILERESDVKSEVLYSVDDVNINCIYTQKEDTAEANIGVYTLYGVNGLETWSEDALSKIKVFIRTLYSFHVRIRAVRVAARSLYKDYELDVYNLNYFIKTVNMLIEEGQIQLYAASRFNLKGFSSVNEQVGRKKGTLAMRQYLSSLQYKLKDGAIISRAGGDNFMMLFHKTELDEVKNHLMGQEVHLNGSEDIVYISASAGFYMIPEGCANATDIMDSISIAAKVAKNSVETSYTAFFDNRLLEKTKKAQEIEALFANALENREFKVFYQPKVDLKDYLMVGAEALCRWFHDGEVISPGDFIPVLEKSQSICKLDFYMLDSVCKDIKRWLETGKQAVKVSVNLSRKHLRNPRILENILEIIDSNQIPHEYIEIELTETTMDLDFDALKQLVAGLKDNNISTSVDDFGTGYSSLNMLREAPWSVIKIDRSYLPDGKNYDEKRMAMLKHIIALSADMGFECIVEGVETVEQLKLIKRNNCFLAQGFYFDKPLAVDEFETRLLDTVG